MNLREAARMLKCLGFRGTEEQVSQETPSIKGSHKVRQQRQLKVPIRPVNAINQRYQSGPETPSIKGTNQG